MSQKVKPVSEDSKKKTKIHEDSSISLRNLQLIFTSFWEGYTEATPKKIKIIDAFCFFCFIITGIQMLYCIIVGNFPMNSFLAGVFTSLGSLIITVCLRFQMNEETRYMNLTNERAIWEYLFCMLILFLVCVNFLG